MKAIVDDKIPYIREAITELMDEVVFMPGKDIKAEDVKDADVLLVRTRTHCNRELLEGSSVRFIATATIGFDHIDTDYLRKAGILWTNCPGCNATSVAQYVHSTLLLLQREKELDLSHCTVGIVGVGNVGSAVLEKIKPLGCNILLNDPPKGLPTPLSELQEKCDVITIHTPLVMDGEHPTYHLFDEQVLSNLQKRPFLINCGRGEVVDNIALEHAIDRGSVRDAIIDTWEKEPNISLTLLDKVYIGTPHVAGYSADGKANATRMVLEALCQWLRRPMTFHIEAPSLPNTADFVGKSANEQSLLLYNPLEDSNRLKAHPEDFEKLRGNYPLRREKV